MIQGCVAFFYVAFIQLCEAVLLYLSKTPDWFNWTANSETGESIGRASKRDNKEKKSGKKRDQGARNEGTSNEVKKTKKSYTEIKKR